MTQTRRNIRLSILYFSYLLGFKFSANISLNTRTSKQGADILNFFIETFYYRENWKNGKIRIHKADGRCASERSKLSHQRDGLHRHRLAEHSVWQRIQWERHEVLLEWGYIFHLNAFVCQHYFVSLWPEEPLKTIAHRGSVPLWTSPIHPFAV